ncbi:MAG: 16S rRNA (cytidine(1402)-2'-O)-methyltransferase [Nitrospirae bacterium]|nr:MAG: 16S rRNA (cytidine(1402)-2'-O)-methyltransferase [Nitrospirota bacterium]
MRPRPMHGILYIVSTPIGNLEDMTFRAVRVLKEVAVIAAEDTRHTKQLCTHFGIHTPLTSYHDFNKEEKTAVLLERLHAGTDVALVSDAGTPVVSDPGFFLITHAIAAGIRAVPVPGPSAVLTALAGAGLPTDAFRFEGFLPRKEGPRSKRIARFREEPATVILFESPHRIAKLLASLLAGLGNRRAVLARELTKHYEEFHRGTLEELTALVRSHPPKGEITLLIEGAATRRRSAPGQEAGQEPAREDE